MLFRASGVDLRESRYTFLAVNHEDYANLLQLLKALGVPAIRGFMSACHLRRIAAQRLTGICPRRRHCAQVVANG